MRSFQSIATALVVVWLKWTSPMEALPGTCLPSRLPDRLGVAHLYAIEWATGDVWDLGSHQAAPSGSQDSAKIIPTRMFRYYFVVVEDIFGNMGCRSDSVSVGLDGVVRPARPVIFR